MFFRTVYKSGQIFLPFCYNPRMWQTDGRTEGQTTFSSLYGVCITCSAVKKRRPPCWNSISGFDFDVYLVIGISFYICLPNFALIGRSAARLWRHIEFTRRYNSKHHKTSLQPFLERYSPFIVSAVCAQDWFHQHKPSVAPHFRPYVPNSLPTTWYKIFESSGRQDSMWSIWFLYYMHAEQLYAIFNNLAVYTGGKDNCLCDNRLEPGLHFSGKSDKERCRLMTVWKNEYVRFPTNVVRLDWDGSPMGNRLY